jgi:hypothetical protein
MRRPIGIVVEKTSSTLHGVVFEILDFGHPGVD